MINIRVPLKIRIKGALSKDKVQYWFDFYKNSYLKNKVSMAEILLHADFRNKSCPKSVVNRLASWFDDYMDEKYPRIANRSYLPTINEYISLVSESRREINEVR